MKFWLFLTKFCAFHTRLEQTFVQHVLEYVVLSVSPASIPKQKSYAMRQIASARHGTSAFMQAFIVVVQPKNDKHKNKLFDVKKENKNTKHGQLFLSFQTQNDHASTK